MEKANEKKGEVEKEITSASKALILFFKGPQESLPALTHGQTLTPGFTQPKSGLIKQTSNISLPEKGWEPTDSGGFWRTFLLFWFVFLMLGLHFPLQG